MDSDVIAVGAGHSELFEILDKLSHEQKLLAITPDAGPNKTIKQFVDSDPAPKFKSALENNPEIKDCPYLNAALVFFSIFPDPQTVDRNRTVLWRAIHAGNKMHSTLYATQIQIEH